MHQKTFLAKDGQTYTLNITVSIGIAYYTSEHSQETQPTELIRQADKAMYTAKKNGKNGVFMVETV